LREKYKTENKKKPKKSDNMLCGRRRKKQNIEEGSILMENPKWIRCPACRNKTRDRIREDTTGGQTIRTL